MSEYHKIQSIYNRDPENRYKTFLIGEFSLPEFEYLQHSEWSFTEKVDGTNIRIFWGENTVTFGGRTDNAQIPATLVNALTELFPVEKMKRVFGSNGYIVLYGEGYGAKIQKGGGNYRSDQSFVLFDIKIDDFWLERDSVVGIASQLEIDFVPEIAIGTLHEAVELCEDGFDSFWGKFQSEGLVLRPKVQLFTRQGKRIITKIKCKDFR